MTRATIIKESINGGLAYGFRGLVYYNIDGEHGEHTGRHGVGELAKSFTSSSVGGRQRENHYLPRAFETSKPTLCDTPAQTRPYLLILLTQFSNGN